MRFGEPLIEGRLLRRYKRFLADVQLADGRTVVAHCANPGSMITCMPTGAPAWLSHHDDPRRKLAYTWELVQNGRAMICVNTAQANRVVHEALAAGKISELSGYTEIRREVAFAGRRRAAPNARPESRVDFRLERGRTRCYLEVKMVTLAESPTVSAFPDSVTERGTRHLEELIKVARRGDRAVLLFCCGRTHTRLVRPAESIDPVYARTLRRAAARGVEVIAYGCRITPQEVRISRALPVAL